MLTNDQAFGLYKQVGENQSLFSADPDAVRKAAVSVVLAQLKHKATKLDGARSIYGALGAATFAAVMDEFKPDAAVAFVKRFDKANAGRAQDDAAWARSHFLKLAAGNLEPDPLPPKVSKSKSQTPTPRPTRTLRQSKSMAPRERKPTQREGE